VATHPYCEPLSPEAGGVIKGLEMTREVAKELKFDGRPIWFTEVGWPLEYPHNQQVRDERQQACFVARLLVQSAAHGVAHIQFMYIEDIVYSKDNTKRSFGFFTAPGQWRQQATAVQVQIRLLPDPRKDCKILREEENGPFAYQAKGAGGWSIIAAWNSGEKEVEQSFDVAAKEATLVDMLGRTSSLKIEGGKVKVTLGEAPVYIVPAAQADVAKVLKN